MKGLLLKDFYSLKTEYRMYVLMFPFLALLMTVMNWNSDGDTSPVSFGYLMTYGVIAVMGLVMNTFTYDEKFCFTQYALATTVSRNVYLAEKYVFLLLNEAIAGVVGVVGMLVLTALKSQTLTGEDVLAALLIAGFFILAAAVMGIWQIGLSVRFDSVKARIVFVIVILAVSVAFASLVILDAATSILVILAVVGVMFTVWMFCMSFVWMKKKEF